jgi:serine/threonine protein phosphatase PrpC
VSFSSFPQLAIAAQTDPGCDPAKAVNEDAFVTCTAACGILLVVCDGMGGHDGGRVASTTAIQVLQSLFETAPPEGASARLLRSMVETAGRAVHALAGPDDDEHRPGSTCVAVLFGRAAPVVAHVGDSRAYRLRNGKLEKLTHDHSLVNDLVLAGIMSPADAHNHPDVHRITRALGMTAQVVVDIKELSDLLRNDCFLLCSDGLTDLVTDEEIAQILENSGTADLKAKCTSLIELAKKRGGHDNVTVVIAQVDQLGDAATVPREPEATESLSTSAMSIPGAVGTVPILPTVALEELPRNVVAPTIVEAALSQPRNVETQPIAIASGGSVPVAAQPVSATVPSVRTWDTQGLKPSATPRSGARWMAIAAIVSGLVILGLLIWAVVH